MRPGADYVAMRDIRIPDSYAYAARAGDDVTETQRVNLRLVVGVDITPLTRDAMPRPEDDADRRAWQDYAVVRGVPYDEAVNLDRGELTKRVDAADKQLAEPVNAGEMPAEGDPKADWAEYAAIEVLRRTGGAVSLEEARERVKGRTKADLVSAFGPNAAPDAASDLTTVSRGEPPVSGDAVAEQGRPADQKE
jgi:hypothetical protein